MRQFSSNSSNQYMDGTIGFTVDPKSACLSWFLGYLQMVLLTNATLCKRPKYQGRRFTSTCHHATVYPRSLALFFACTRTHIKQVVAKNMLVRTCEIK